MIVPRLRKKGLLIQELRDEVLVYDLERHKAHCLNPTAALIWRHCNGRTTVSEMAALLEEELGIPADEGLVWSALEKLGRAHLLRERVTRPEGVPRQSRRELLRKLALGLAGGVLLPAVTSILAPVAASHGSCAHVGESCATLNCCTGCACVATFCIGTC